MASCCASWHILHACVLVDLAISSFQKLILPLPLFPWRRKTLSAYLITIVNFMARHGEFYSQMFSALSCNAQYCSSLSNVSWSNIGCVNRSMVCALLYHDVRLLPYAEITFVLKPMTVTFYYAIFNTADSIYVFMYSVSFISRPIHC